MDDQPADPTIRTPTPGPTPSSWSSTPPSSSWSSTPPPPPPATPGPAWPAPPHRERDGRWGSVVAGLIILGIGLWYFADRTLGLTMPHIDWARGWPLILVLIGAVMIVGSIRRR